MTDLAKEACVPADGDSPPIPEAEKALLTERVPGWRTEWKRGMAGLERAFRIEDYRRAADFVREVAELACEQDHHPSIVLDVGAVSVRWSSHGLGGLHRNDFIMAAKTDELYDPSLLPSAPL